MKKTDKINNIVKQQHFIPRMYLKRFADDTNRTYVLRDGIISYQHIDKICRSHYLYEYRDYDGNIKDLNKAEKDLSNFEYVSDQLLDQLISELDKNHRFFLSNDTKLLLTTILVFMFLRNPLVVGFPRQAANTVQKEELGRSINNWGITNIFKKQKAWVDDLTDNHFLLIHRNCTSKPFVTSSLPVYFWPGIAETIELKRLRWWSMPISEKYYMQLIPNKFWLCNCVIDTSIEAVTYFNKITFRQGGNMITISSEISVLEEMNEIYQRNKNIVINKDYIPNFAPKSLTGPRIEGFDGAGILKSY